MNRKKILQESSISHTHHCPYCASLSYILTSTAKQGTLTVEGECVRCKTTGHSFSFSPISTVQPTPSNVMGNE